MNRPGRHPGSLTSPLRGRVPPPPSRYAPPLAPVQLRERHADRGYVEAEDAENGADVVSLEEDMALR